MRALVLLALKPFALKPTEQFDFASRRADTPWKEKYHEPS